MSKLILYLYLVSLTVDSYYCWFTDVNTKMLSQGDGISTDDLQSLAKQFNILIIPGTKWCGPSNKADSYDDLGEEKEADMCCRDHDHCPDIISGGETKHNLTNYALYTRLNCSCDYKFRECLHAANTNTANLIGAIYFDALQTECFREDYPVTGCAKRGGLLKTKCVEYSYNTSGDKSYQWFDVPDY